MLGGNCCSPSFPGPPGPSEPIIVVNRIDAGNVGGSRLVAVDATLLASGAVASVFSVGALFELVKVPTAALLAAVDGITVVQSALNPAWIWVRLPQTSAVERFSANPPLFIDAGAGNDDNDGLGAGASALKSAGEWSRRMEGSTLAAALTVSLKGNVGGLGPVTVASKGGASLHFQGPTPTATGTGTIGATFTDNVATGVEEGFTQTAGTALATGSERLRITVAAVGAHVGATCYVKGFRGGVVSEPCTGVWTTGVTTPGVDATIITPSNGDTFAIETEGATVTGIHLEWLPVSGVAGTGYVSFQDLIGDQGATRGVWYLKTWGKPSENDAHGVLFRCRMSSSFAPACDFSQSDWWFRACDMRLPTILSATAFYGIDCCMFRNGMTTDTCGFQFIGRSCVDSGTAQVFAVGPGSIIIDKAGSSLCFSRCANQGIVANAGSILKLSGGTYWAPAYSAAAFSRNSLTDGFVGQSGSGTFYGTSVLQLTRMRSSSGNPTVLAGAAVVIPAWDSAHGCGCVEDL